MIKMLNFSTCKIGRFATRKVVFVRDGQNIWSKQKRWPGWLDMRLSSTGIKQSRQCGKLLKEAGHEFDEAYTSVLTRSVQSFNKICEQLDCFYIPVHKSWRLNEKHYGSLQGENKGEVRQKYGQIAEQWRRSLNVRPPKLQQNDPTAPRNDKKYSHVDSSLLPLSESLQDVVNRVKPLWQEQIRPKVIEGKNILVVAHGNTLRAFSYMLTNMKQQILEDFNVPHCIPLVFTFNERMEPLNYHYLGEQSQIITKIETVQKQTQIPLKFD